MPDPWDIPPVPQIGDPDARMTYQAVGFAMSKWEALENALATLYGIFIPNPGDPILCNYGTDVSMRFVERADAIERAASAYFARNPNQHVEGDFDSLIYRCRKFSLRRNDIAHGIVTYCVGPLGPIGDLLYPTLFIRKKHEGGKPSYIYSSREIVDFAAHFKKLRDDVFRLCDQIQGKPAS